MKFSILKEKIIDFIEKNKLLSSIICLIVLILLVKILSVGGKNSIIKNYNYKEGNIDNILDNFNESYLDRENYYIINNIIEELYSKYNSSTNNYEEYYECMDSSLRWSKRKFKNKLFNLINKANESTENFSNLKIRMYSYNFQENIYLMQLANSDNENIGWIGIGLDKDINKYYIFYIE